MICTSWGTACINFSTWELWNHIIFVQYSKHSLSGYHYMAGITTWQWYNWANITLHWDSSSASLKTNKGNLKGKTFNFPYSCFESFDDHDVKVEWLEEMQYVRWLHVQYICWFKITRHHHYWIWSNKCTSNMTHCYVSATVWSPRSKPVQWFTSLAHVCSSGVFLKLSLNCIRSTSIETWYAKSKRL